MALITPQEKAKELVKAFRGTMTGPGIEANDRNAPVAASLCVDEIFKVYKQLSEDDDIMFPNEIRYWEQVKEEINKV